MRPETMHRTVKQVAYDANHLQHVPQIRIETLTSGAYTARVTAAEENPGEASVALSLRFTGKHTVTVNAQSQNSTETGFVIDHGVSSTGELTITHDDHADDDGEDGAEAADSTTTVLLALTNVGRYDSKLVLDKVDRVECIDDQLNWA